MDLDLKKIKDYVGIQSYIKGAHYSGFIQNVDIETKNKVHTYIFYVESEHFYDKEYEVTIQIKEKEIAFSHCTCMQFSNFKTCKHVAACLIQYKDEIFYTDSLERKLSISKMILKEFAQESKKNKQIKKQLHLDVIIYFAEYYDETSVYIDLKLGEKKMYNLNNKFSNFAQVYEKQEGTVIFGKLFVYDPDQYFFSKEDEAIIEYLLKINQSYHFKNFKISINEFASFLDLLKNKPFTIYGHGIIKEIKKENPIQLSFQKNDDNYQLSFMLDNITVLTSNYQYIAKDETLFILPPKSLKILSLMKENHLEEIEFQEEDLSSFKEGILPIIKNNLVLDETVKDKIILGMKPKAKLYFDIHENIVFCHPKFVYQEQEIDYFIENSIIIRDQEEENQVIEKLLQLGFKIENQKMFLDDIDQLAYLLEEGFNDLIKDYEVFTSENLKRTQIIRNSNIRSSFSIGEDNIMHYDFDLGNISNNEINSILDAFRQKKKYYRMLDGNLLDLTQNNELEQFENLVETMNLSKKEIKDGNGIIPKYRAIYLDSLKKEKYNIIETNNLFDQLIQQFTSYKDLPVHLTSKDKKILRDYQEIGVKWLYNIYKCGFGGILADEMGLGKSIQLIYFIKEIIKEKPNALFLIVAPTSLIYNWKNEFDKFGSELKYKVFAENRKIRKQELENIKDVQILITTYGLLRQDKEKYETMNFELIAIDEAQTIKNSNAQMTRVVKNLKATTKIALTGTPLENSVMELWSIFDFIMPGYLAEITTFQKKYHIKDVTDDDLKNLDSLKEQIKPFILRRRKKDVVKELPPKIENNISIDLNKEQKKLYVATLKKTQEEMDTIIKTEGFKKGNFKILQLLTKLRQLCIDPRIVFEEYHGGSAKIENLVEIVQGIIQNEHKILIFTSFKTALNIVKSELDKNNISSYVIDGSVPSKKRMELVEKFNHDNTPVFLITLKAGGTGLNLTSADVVIHLDLWWNPQVENQATDRAHRIGQTNNVEVIKLVCKGTIEERILKLQEKKKVLSEALIEGKDSDQNIFSKLTEKDIKNLLTMDNEEDD